MRIIVVAVPLLVLAIAGCAETAPPQRWSRPDTTYGQFVQDRRDCAREAREESETFILGGQYYGGASGSVDTGLFVPCMVARGYRQDPKGFAPPPNDNFAFSP